MWRGEEWVEREGVGWSRKELDREGRSEVERGGMG